MPQDLRTETVRTLREFTELVEALEDNPTPWYRGCGRRRYELVPGLYRHPVRREVEELLEIEKAIISRFKERSVPYLTRNLPAEHDWEFLFLMQHHGAPTRLLDWTENPFIALYFAITAAPSTLGEGGPEFSEDAALWILNPDAWNKHVLRHLSYERGILSIDDAPLTGYAPSPEGPLNREAVALFGIYNSPRIVAQRGVFTISGQNTAPIENVYTNGDFPGNCLMKIILPRQSLNDLSQSIFRIGIADSVVWPDLDGLAREIKRQFGYEV